MAALRLEDARVKGPGVPWVIPAKTDGIAQSCLSTAILLPGHDRLGRDQPSMSFVWLTTGGIAYTAGVVFYVLDGLNRLTHAHGIWHFFVLAGSGCHFISVIGYVR